MEICRLLLSPKTQKLCGIKVFEKIPEKDDGPFLCIVGKSTPMIFSHIHGRKTVHKHKSSNEEIEGENIVSFGETGNEEGDYFCLISSFLRQCFFQKTRIDHNPRLNYRFFASSKPSSTIHVYLFRDSDPLLSRFESLSITPSSHIIKEGVPFVSKELFSRRQITHAFWDLENGKEDISVLYSPRHLWERKIKFRLTPKMLHHWQHLCRIGVLSVKDICENYRFWFVFNKKIPIQFADEEKKEDFAVHYDSEVSHIYNLV